MKSFILGFSVFFLSALIVYILIRHKQVNAETAQPIPYGEITLFYPDKNLQFADFQIRYVGKTSRKLSLNPNLVFTYYHFVITTSDNKKRTLIWCSGTGDIGPVFFAIGNQVYQLELKYGEQGHRKLNDHQMVISLSKMNVSEYVFYLIHHLSSLAQYNIEMLQEVLGLSFQETNNENEYFHLLKSDGFGPISNVELRIHKNNPQKKLLILEINSNLKISQESLREKYPYMKLNVHNPADPTYLSLSMAESWGNISFGFNKSGMLTTVVIDTLEK